MRHNLDRRLRSLERKGVDSGADFWHDKGDGFLHHPDGRKLAREEFNAKYPNAARFTPRLNIPASDRESI